MTISKTDIARSSSVFVIVGLFQGIVLLATDYIAGRVFHPDLVTGIILLVLVLSNGGFHLDGLADTFDALAAKSEDNRDADKLKRLAIMKDGKTGPIGVVAIVFTLALKYLSLSNLTHLLPFTYFSSLLLMPVLSKWATVVSMFHGKPARIDGLGETFINRVGLKEFGISTFILLLLLTFHQVFFNRYAPDNQYVFFVFLLVTLYLSCRMGINFFHKKFGGLTGDTLGAISEITELIFLLMVIAWSRLSI
jgi:adenosylcobinamide-GDP ribazoletransferase